MRNFLVAIASIIMLIGVWFLHTVLTSDNGFGFANEFGFNPTTLIIMPLSYWVFSWHSRMSV